MSLQVWLPLTNGTLKQQGLKNISATIGGTVGLTDVGKLGKCATIGTAAGGITLPASAMTSFTECSVAFWINITSWNTDWDTIFQAGLGSTPWNNYIFGILRNQGNYLCFTVSNGSSTSSGSYASSNLTVGQWMHLAFTYGNGKCKIYINGVLDKEYSTSITPNFAGITHIAIGRSTNGSNYQCKCKLNDFRIYDHCLSPMEVKELSQGLVLHYPLNRQGWGQENLYTTSQDFSGSWNNKGSWATSEETYQNFIVKQKSTVWGGLSQNIPCSNGDIFTISFYAKVDAGGRICSVHRSSLGNVTTGLTILGGNFISGTDWINATDDGTQWKRYWATVRIDSSDITYLQWRIENSVANKTLYICGMKMERGSIATPWCPNSSDALATTIGLNSTIEYDCSGFCNNGTRTGTFDWTSNTAKYAVSTKFNGTDNAIQTPSLPTMITDKNYTIAVWIYKTVIGSKGYQTIYGGPSGFEIEARNGSANETKFVPWNWGKPMASYELNEWNHCVFVHSDADCKIYLNGEYIATGTAKASNPTGNYFVGAWNTATQQNFDGLMSDFRIYATALSASDVKSLYQNSAYIDSSGNIYGAVHTEV